MEKSKILDLSARVADKYLGSFNWENTYPNELFLEALLALTGLGLDSKYRQIVSDYMERHQLEASTVRNWRDQQFHDISYPWFRQAGAIEDYREAYVASTRAWMREAARRPNGAIIHNCRHDPVGSLVDMVQAYFIRLGRCALLTGDSAFVEEALGQLRAHREELRSPSSGCYHQGRGWLPDDGLSPAPWSRGQGWYLHGLVHTIPLIAGWPDAQAEFSQDFREHVDSLLRLQQASGFWHQLVDQPDESFPDTSGTAFIFEAIELGIGNGSLSGEGYLRSAGKAWRALVAQVGEDGTIDQACKGPGTIWETEPWRNRRAPAGDPHGVFTMLFACAARLERAG